MKYIIIIGSLTIAFGLAFLIWYLLKPDNKKNTDIPSTTSSIPSTVSTTDDQNVVPEDQNVVLYVIVFIGICIIFCIIFYFIVTRFINKKKKTKDIPKKTEDISKKTEDISNDLTEKNKYIFNDLPFPSNLITKNKRYSHRWTFFNTENTKKWEEYIKKKYDVDVVDLDLHTTNRLKSIENLTKEMEKNENIVYIQLGSNHHANVLIIDKKKKTILRWDPNGSESIQSKLIDTEMKSVLDKDLHDLFKEYSYETKSSIGFTTETHKEGDKGRCYIWTCYFIELAIANKNVPDIIDKVISKIQNQTIKESIDLIDGYTFFLTNGMRHTEHTPQLIVDILTRTRGLQMNGDNSLLKEKKKIEDSIRDNEKFIELHHLPFSVHVNGKRVVTINGKKISFTPWTHDEIEKRKEGIERMVGSVTHLENKIREQDKVTENAMKKTMKNIHTKDK